MGQTALSGGVDDDWIFAFDQAIANGDSGEDILFGSGTSTLIGGADDDLLVAFSGQGMKVDGGLGNDTIVSIGGVGQDLDGGAGNDLILSVGGINHTIFGGAGEDTIFAFSEGTVVSGGTENDSFYFGPNILIDDAEAGDSLSLFGIPLIGAIRNAASEDPYAYGLGGLVKYGLNTNGDLLVQTIFSDKTTFISNYVGGPSVLNPTAGIQVAEIEIDFFRLLDPDLPDGSITKTLESFAFIKKYFVPNLDPLVLDLEDDGLELTANSSVAVSFDLDDDGFAERTGWVRPGDGFLVRDINSNGLIDSIAEMFGSSTTNGFADLALLNDSVDLVIDASDSAFADLMVWQDLDQDGVTDAGELKTLADLNIQSIDLTAAPPPAGQETNAGNQILEVAGFTFTDLSVGKIFEVGFNYSNFYSTYLGDSTVSAPAAALPELHGHGTLANLRIAMSNDAALLTAAQTAALAAPTTLDGLRAAILPVLRAWGGDDPVNFDPIPYAYTTNTDGSINVLDFGYIDTATGFWRLNSGNAVVDALGVVIAEPTLADIQSQTISGTWGKIEAADVAFYERYFGDEFPVSELTSGYTGRQGMESYVESLLLAPVMTLWTAVPGMAMSPPMAACARTMTCPMTRRRRCGR
jgi:hypothetical protein